MRQHYKVHHKKVEQGHPVIDRLNPKAAELKRELFFVCVGVNIKIGRTSLLSDRAFKRARLSSLLKSRVKMDFWYKGEHL